MRHNCYSVFCFKGKGQGKFLCEKLLVACVTLKDTCCVCNFNNYSPVYFPFFWVLPCDGYVSAMRPPKCVDEPYINNDVCDYCVLRLRTALV